MSRKVNSIALIYQPYMTRSMALLASVCAVAVFLYGIFLLEAVAHAAARVSAERQIQKLSASLSVLEGQYLTQTQAITPTRAKELGFVAPISVSTVFNTAVSRSLSLKGK